MHGGVTGPSGGGGNLPKDAIEVRKSIFHYMKCYLSSKYYIII
jgi:hypothetical protein